MDAAAGSGRCVPPFVCSSSACGSGRKLEKTLALFTPGKKYDTDELQQLKFELILQSTIPVRPHRSTLCGNLHVVRKRSHLRRDPIGGLYVVSSMGLISHDSSHMRPYRSALYVNLQVVHKESQLQWNRMASLCGNLQVVHKGQNKASTIYLYIYIYTHTAFRKMTYLNIYI